MRKYGECPNCKKEIKLSKHHILPKCHYGKNGECILICIPCHRELEFKILKTEGKPINNKRRKLKKKTYYYLLYEFLGS